MKKSISRGAIIVFLLSLFFQGYSQTDQGKIMLGGQYVLNFNSDKSTYNGSTTNGLGKSQSISLAPQIGYFIFKNVPVGIEFVCSYSKSGNDVSSSHISSYTFMPYLRYYFGESKIKPYLEGSAGPGWGKTTYSYSGNTITENEKLFTYQAKAGLCVFINETIGLDLGIGYKSMMENYTVETLSGEVKAKYVTEGIHAVLGIMVHF